MRSKKYCPYNTRYTQTDVYTHVLNESAQEIYTIYSVIADQTPSPCYGEACGAWYRGHCARK